MRQNLSLLNMKKMSYKQILTFICTLLISTNLAHAATIPIKHNADSLMRTLWKYSEHYENKVQHYESRVYMKRHIWKKKKNVLMELVPQMMSFEKGTNEYLTESISEVNYTAPYNYDRHVLAAYGTVPNLKDASDLIMDYFTMNIYSPEMIKDHLLSPFVYDNAKYYYYNIHSIEGDEAIITFIPQYMNTQLVKGRFVLDMTNHLVKNVDMEGSYEFIEFNMHMEMGREGLAVYLPSESELFFKFKFMGNSLEGHYMAAHEYTTLDEEYKNYYSTRKSHDLTDQYALSLDTTKFQFDSLLVAKNRFFPLQPDENLVYINYANRNKESRLSNTALSDTTKTINWGNLGKSMVASSTINAPIFGKIKASPFLAPMLFNYSKSRGFDWLQELTMNKDFKHTALMIAPMIGYNFTYHEFDWRVRASLDYWKAMQAKLSLEAGNGYRIFSSEIADMLDKTDAKKIDNLEVNYFNDIHVKLNQKLELLNGLEITLGFAWYRRHLTDRKDVDEDYPVPYENPKETYTTFAPRVRVDLTPGKYYYWNGNKKVTVMTPAPTISFDWEKGINGVLGSKGKYERLEVEISHEREYRLKDRFSYRIGYGKYKKQENIYFIDFNNFSHNHLPEGWSEEIGGSFSLLNYRWYSSANEYLRGHLTYEKTSLLLARALGKTSHSIKAERLYLSALAMKHLNPYIEFGYGFATHIFDCGIFTSLRNGKFNTVGAKFSFVLFKR